MSANLSVILSRLTQTVYDLNTRMFFNRRIVKISDEVKSALGNVLAVLIQWKSSDKDGKSFLASEPSHIIAIFGDPEHSSLFTPTEAAINRYLDDCSSFVLGVDDFASLAAYGAQRYYVTSNNRLEVLETEVTINADQTINVELNRYSISKDEARIRMNTFQLPASDVTAITPETILSSSESDAGVCRCSYSCANSGCNC